MADLMNLERPILDSIRTSISFKSRKSIFLNTKNGWILIDSGLRSDHSRNVGKILNGPLKTEKIHSLLITHYHPDHIGMAGWLQKN